MKSEIIQRELGFFEYLTMSVYFYLTFASALLPLAYVIYLPIDIMNLSDEPFLIIVSIGYGLLAYSISAIGITYVTKLLLQQKIASVDSIIGFLTSNTLNAIKTDLLVQWRIIYQPLLILIVGGMFLHALSEEISGIWMIVGSLVFVVRIPHLSVLYSFCLQNGVHHGIWGAEALNKSKERIESGSRMYWQIVGIKTILFFGYLVNGVLSQALPNSMMVIMIVSIIGTGLIAYEQTLMAIYYLNNNRADFTQPKSDTSDSSSVRTIFASLDRMSSDYRSIKSLKTMQSLNTDAKSNSKSIRRG